MLASFGSKVVSLLLLLLLSASLELSTRSAELSRYPRLKRVDVIYGWHPCRAYRHSESMVHNIWWRAAKHSPSIIIWKQRQELFLSNLTLRLILSHFLHLNEFGWFFSCQSNLWSSNLQMLSVINFRTLGVNFQSTASFFVMENKTSCRVSFTVKL